MLKIAITGNIASGKSQVEKILSELGYTVYDSDDIAHDVLNDIDDFFGHDVFTNSKIDRKKLGNLVFKNPELKKKLEEITHPKIKSQILSLFKKHKDDRFVFISVPLLYEAGFDTIFDKVILVTVDSKTQLKRLMQRNNLTEEDAIERINSQNNQEEKIFKADFIISNNSSLDDLECKIKDIIQKL